MPAMPAPLRMRIDALILDMDGVLADTEPLHVRAWDLALSGISSAVVLKERARLSGMSSPDIARELILTFALPLSVEELVWKKRGIYRGMIESGLSAFPGLVDELSLWRDRPLALATSSPREETAMMLERMGFAGWFDPVITCDDVRRAKPAPDCYALAAQRLGMRPADCIVIEDSAHGIRAAQDAGARVLAVTTTAMPERTEGLLGVFPGTVQALQWLRD